MPKVIVEDGSHRQHRQCLESLLESTKGSVRIATAYLTDSDLLSGIKHRKVQLLTSVLAMDIVSGATSLTCLKSLIDTGVQCRRVSDGPRLHAKVYIFGTEFAVVTSANLTGSALDSNIEVGIQLDGKAVLKLIDWFDFFWAEALPITSRHLAKWSQQVAGLRREYESLRKKARRKKTGPPARPVSDDSRKQLRDLAGRADCFFVCNTDRRWSKSAEDQMRRRKYAVVWEDFRYPTHMQQVKRGDVILMFAKGVGIVGIGYAKGKCEIRGLRDTDWVRSSAKEWTEREWRVPVEDWLVWVDDDLDAFPCAIPNVSFLDVSGEQYDELREGVIAHFCAGGPTRG